MHKHNFIDCVFKFLEKMHLLRCVPFIEQSELLENQVSCEILCKGAFRIEMRRLFIKNHCSTITLILHNKTVIRQRESVISGEIRKTLVSITEESHLERNIASFLTYRRLADVETTSCVYWEKLGNNVLFPMLHFYTS